MNGRSEPAGPLHSRPGRGTSPTGTPRVQDQIAAIPNLPRAALIEQWSSGNGHLPPKGLSRRLLEHSAAYYLQSKAFGGLKPTVRRKLRQLTRSGHAGNSPTAASKGLSAGSRLVREWHGRTYTVDVLETGFLCDGQHYRSLSEVARAITGARWSGPRFFGL